MFKSARLKLTLFYLVILLAFSLTLTGSFRVLFEHEYTRSNSMERSGLLQLFRGVYLPEGQPYDDFTDIQTDQAVLTHQRLNQDLLFINVAALAVGGVLSYWFAGRALKPIEEAHTAQARFASDASHELRTPLTNLKLENEVFLRQKDFTQAEARELISSNLEEVQRLEGLSSNLLALTQYGNTPLKLKPVAVRAIIAGGIKHAQKAADVRQVVFVDESQASKVLGHAESLEQLLGILLDNAVKYGPEQGAVTIGGHQEDGHYVLWVKDSGPGIAAKDLPHIFDRLYRGDSARSSKTGGYGLGLSLGKAIARANNADIRAENTPHGGACLLVRLPLVKS